MDKLSQDLSFLKVSNTNEEILSLPTEIVCKRCQSNLHLSKLCPYRKDRSYYKPLKPKDIFDKIEIVDNYSRRLFKNEYKVTKMRKHIVEVDFDPLVSFKDSNLHEIVIHNLEYKYRFEYPTAVQKCSIPIILKGRDVLVRAQTGSGKTVAIMAPIISFLLEDDAPETINRISLPRCLVLSPTRELCYQLHTNIMALSYDSGIRHVLTYGGTNTNGSRDELREGCDIIVGTPARIRHFIGEGLIDLSQCKYFIVDEADEVIKSMKSDLNSIVSKLPPPLNEDGSKMLRQTIMFSATFLNIKFSSFDTYLRKYIYVNVGLDTGSSNSIIQKIDKVSSSEKPQHIIDLLNELRKHKFKVMIFVQSIYTCDRLNTLLKEQIPYINVDNLHSATTQQKRELILENYKKEEIEVLICTDVACRGLDISGVEYIIQYDVAPKVETYIHRIGRGGRCGNKAISITFFDPLVDNFCVKTFRNEINETIETVCNKKKMARLIIEVLANCEQEVPKWFDSLAFY